MNPQDKTYTVGEEEFKKLELLKELSVEETERLIQVVKEMFK